MIDPQRNTSQICLCKENQAQYTFPITLISKGEQAEVALRVDSRHALANYFKFNVPIFEGIYKFVHGPLCGLTHLGPSADGKLKFPFYYNPQLRDQPVTCIWELQVHPDKDLWIHLDKLIFASSAKSCADAKLEFYLPSSPAPPVPAAGGSGSYYNTIINSMSAATPVQRQQPQPLLTLCGDSNLANRKTEISSQLPILTAQKLKQGGPLTIRLDAAAASKITFLISWTELFQLPKNPDGSLMMSKLEQKNIVEECGFLCPGPEGVCIAKELECNGVQNCPSNNSSEPHDESEFKCRISQSRIMIMNWSFNISWMTAAIAGGSGALLLCLFCVCCYRCCRRKDSDDDY